MSPPQKLTPFGQKVDVAAANPLQISFDRKGRIELAEGVLDVGHRLVVNALRTRRSR